MLLQLVSHKWCGIKCEFTTGTGPGKGLIGQGLNLGVCLTFVHSDRVLYTEFSVWERGGCPPVPEGAFE
jgi:hypothetical protein